LLTHASVPRDRRAYPWPALWRERDPKPKMDPTLILMLPGYPPATGCRQTKAATDHLFGGPRPASVQARSP